MQNLKNYTYNALHISMVLKTGEEPEVVRNPALTAELKSMYTFQLAHLKVKNLLRFTLNSCHS